jgi:hypothetical protein
MEKRLLAILFVLASAVSSRADLDPAPQDRRGEGFSIGPRFSNYSTEVDIDVGGIDTGRENAFGVVGGYRSGQLVFDFQLDHDPENGISLIDLLPIDFSNYERDRFEATVGWAALPALDLQAGFRFDTLDLGRGFNFNSSSLEHSALAAGIHVHTPSNEPFGVYGLVRGYIGELQFQDDDDDFGSRNEIDSTATRIEGGIILPIGESAWRVVPGVEFERIEAEDLGMTFETNRFFVNVVYTFGR